MTKCLSASMLVLVSLTVFVAPNAAAAFPGPNGKIAFVRTLNRDDVSQIVVVSPGGERPRRLTDGDRFKSDPAWSPNGKVLAFEAVNSLGSSRIRLIRADGTPVGTMSRGLGRLEEDQDPAWSRNGARLAFAHIAVRARDRQPQDIYIMDADGGGRRRITRNPASDYQPAWSPVDDVIAFASERSGAVDIFTKDLDTGGLTQLTSNPSADSEPNWAPDGSGLVFTRSVTGTLKLFTMDADGSNVVEVVGFSGSNALHPAFSPNGNKIVFTRSWLGGGSVEASLWSIRPNGSGLTRLTPSVSGKTRSQPDWQPRP